MQQTVIPFNSRRWTAALLGSVVLLAACAYVLVVRPSLKADVAGAVGVVFFGVAVWVAAWRLRRREAEMTISHEGFHVAGGAPVAWSEVRSVGARTVTVRGIKREFLEVVLLDPAAYTARLSGLKAVVAKANAAAQFGAVNIAPLGRGYRLDHILTLMRQHNPALVVTSVPVPAAQGSTVRRLGKTVLLWGGVAAVLVVGVEVYVHVTGDVSTAEVGSCLSMSGDDGNTAKVVDCTDADARYKVVAEFTKKTEEDNTAQNLCDGQPSARVQFWYGKQGEPGVVWCLAPAH
jgi:hypothetical protein